MDEQQPALEGVGATKISSLREPSGDGSNIGTDLRLSYERFAGLVVVSLVCAVGLGEQEELSCCTPWTGCPVSTVRASK